MPGELKPPVFEKGYPDYDAVNKQKKILNIDSIRKSGF